MIIFWSVIIILFVILYWMLIPALRGRKLLHDQDQNNLNIAIARERLDELEKSYAQQQITDEEYTQTRAELEKALLDDISDAQTNTQLAAVSKPLFATIVIGIPILALALYFQLGNPDALDMPMARQTAAHGNSPHSLGSVEQMVNQLALKLQKNPANLDGWKMLGRSYMSMKRYPEAVNAFQQAYQLAGDRVDVVLAYADALAMADQGKISGKPFELVQQALKLDPANIMGLWLAGLGYDEAGDYEQAVSHWRKLEPMLQNNPQSLAEVRNLIAGAEHKLGRSVTVTPEATQPVVALAGIQVEVRLSPDLANKVPPQTTVFIFARALQGPPMPLAVVRKQVGELPLSVKLDDTMAMMPQLKLSNFDQVTIGARISQSGQPVARSGDYEGEVSPVNTTSAKTVEVVIDKIVP